MRFGKKMVFSFALSSVVLAGLFWPPQAKANFGNEYDAVCDYIENRYQGKKEKIPFLWLARFAVGIIRPAGVKSFKVTIYKNLRFSRTTVHDEMAAIMKNAFSTEWSPILRVRSKEGEQVYMNMRRSGKKNLKILLVTIGRDEAVVIRAKFNPEKLAEFIDDPKMFGISLDSRNRDIKVGSEKVQKQIKSADEACQEPDAC